MTVFRFLQVDFRQAQSPGSMIAITTIEITTPIAMFWCVLWLSGLFLDVGADTTLDSVEVVELEDREEEKEESEGDSEKGDEADNLGGRDGVVCATLGDEADDLEGRDNVVCTTSEDDDDDNDLDVWAGNPAPPPAEKTSDCAARSSEWSLRIWESTARNSEFSKRIVIVDEAVTYNRSYDNL